MANRCAISFESFDDYDVVVVDDLSSWEFIDPSLSSDGEDLDNFSFTEEEEENLCDDVVMEFKEENPHEFGSPSSDISMQSLLTELQPANIDYLSGSPSSGVSNQSLRIELSLHNLVYDQDQEEEEEENGGEYDDEDDYYDDDDGYDLDDELVPLRVSGKLERQRIRKLGKRSCSRMNRSKRLPYKYNRPGCVHGKHGLGVQHSYI